MVKGTEEGERWGEMGGAEDGRNKCGQKAVKGKTGQGD